MAGKKFLNTRETASMFGFKKSWLEQRRHRGEGPPFYRLGDGNKRGVVYDPGEVEEWIRSQRRPRVARRTKTGTEL